MGKLPSLPEYVQKEFCQAITLKSGKEVERDVNKKKRVVDDEDDGVDVKEVEVRSKKDEKCEKKDDKGDDIPPKDDEPKVDLRTLPFP